MTDKLLRELAEKNSTDIGATNGKLQLADQLVRYAAKTGAKYVREIAEKNSKGILATNTKLEFADQLVRNLAERNLATQLQREESGDHSILVLRRCKGSKGHEKAMEMAKETGTAAL